MANKQMPGVVIRDLTPEDLKDPNLVTLNEYLREAATAANIMAGAHGDIPLTSDLDLQGQQIKNPPTAATATEGAGTLPAKPVGFIVVTIGTQQYKLPYYNP
jgi:hypothetical protein